MDRSLRDDLATNRLGTEGWRADYWLVSSGLLRGAASDGERSPRRRSHAMGIDTGQLGLHPDPLDAAPKTAN